MIDLSEADPVTYRTVELNLVQLLLDTVKMDVISKISIYLIPETIAFQLRHLKGSFILMTLFLIVPGNQNAKPKTEAKWKSYIRPAS